MLDRVKGSISIAGSVLEKFRKSKENAGIGFWTVVFLIALVAGIIGGAYVYFF